MPGTHGDLYAEIGRLVLAAHAGQTIDLTAKSEELARRHRALGLPPETIARAIARSLGAVGVSMAIVSPAGAADAKTAVNGNGASGEPILMNGANGNGHVGHAGDEDEPQTKSSSALFPSGVRLAVLS